MFRNRCNFFLVIAIFLLLASTCLAEDACLGCCDKDPEHPDRRTLVILIHGINADASNKEVQMMQEQLSGNRCLDVRIFDWSESQESCVDIISGQLYDAIVDALYDDSEEYCSIFVAGHSAGGIIASHLFSKENPLGDDFSELENLCVQLETFGSTFGGYFAPGFMVNGLSYIDGCFWAQIADGFHDMGDSHAGVMATHFTHPDDGWFSLRSQQGGLTNADKPDPIEGTDHSTIISAGFADIASCCEGQPWCNTDADCQIRTGNPAATCDQSTGCCRTEPPYGEKGGSASGGVSGGELDDDDDDGGDVGEPGPVSPTRCGDPSDLNCTGLCGRNAYCVSNGNSCRCVKDGADKLSDTLLESSM